MKMGVTDHLGSAELGERLLPVVSGALGGGVVRLDGLTQLSGGASRETWSFDAVDGGGGRTPLILQRRRALAFDDGLSMEAESAILRAAEAAGVPVAHHVAADDATAALGAAFLIVERLQGEAIPPRILRDDDFAEARTHLAEQYGEALGRIHGIPVEAVPGLRRQDPLDYWDAVLQDIGYPHPALELGLRWLRANDPRDLDMANAVVHGDFRNGNGVVDRDGLRAVIDWELAHVGDPLEDVGWFCIRAWRFGAKPPVGGFGTYEQFLGGYERTSGRRVPRDVLRWWQVLGSLRWAVICINQGATHLNGVRRSIELAAVGRRACEAEFDMLLLLP
jgi:aminoglycoside phosphotransferase (APT) family kinase protein